MPSNAQKHVSVRKRLRKTPRADQRFFFWEGAFFLRLGDQLLFLRWVFVFFWCPLFFFEIGRPTFTFFDFCWFVFRLGDQRFFHVGDTFEFFWGRQHLLGAANMCFCLGWSHIINSVFRGALLFGRERERDKTQREEKNTRERERKRELISQLIN